MNYESEIEFAKALAEQAGEMIRQGFGLDIATIWKPDETPVTATDTAVNDMVIERIKEKYPSDGILGEEASYEMDRERLWVVDPVDGTYSFTLGAPMSTFLLALVIDGQPVLGIIYDPYLMRMFWAVKGAGSYLNDQPIHVSDKAELNHAMIILSSKQVANKTAGILFDEIEDLGGRSFNFRAFGYGSGFVAAGSAVAAVIGKPYPWDVAATKIIIEEAGGTVTDLAGNDRRYDREGNGLVASNGILHDEMLKLIQT